MLTLASRRSALIIALLALAQSAVLWGGDLPAATSSQPPDYPQSLRRALKSLLDAHAPESTDPDTLIRLATLYLDMGDNLFNDTVSRIDAYDEGARIAKRALDMREDNAEAHFLYAANLGSAMHLKGVFASALGVRDVKAHTAHALQLNKDHAPALHMMGMLLEELPRLLGGDQAAALDHVQRAVAIAPDFTHARLDLAKMYVKRKNLESAKRELRTIIAMERPMDYYAWTHREKPEAEDLLRSLDAGKRVAP